MKKILGLFGLAAACITASGCSLKKDWEYIEKNGKMVVGYTLFEPIAYEENGQLTGFDIELAKETGKVLGIDVEFQLIDWESKEFELNSRTIDLVWNGLTVTDERKENMEFTQSYLRNNQIAVIRKTDMDKYTSIDTIMNTEGVRYCAEAGSAGQDVVESYNKECAKISNMVTCLTEVQSGNSDVAIMDSVMARYYTDDKDDLMIVENTIFIEEEYGIAARKGDTEFVGKINEALKTLKENGKLMELADKYGLTDDIII